MQDLPLATQRNLIEPLSGYKHLRKVLAMRFLGFMSQIERSAKGIPKRLLNFIKHDVRSTTGRNLRKILLLTEKTNVEQLDKIDASSVKYHPLREEEAWKVNLIKELIDIKFEKITVENLTMEEIEETVCFVATS